MIRFLTPICHFNDFYPVLFYRIYSVEAQLPSRTGGRAPDSIDFVHSLLSIGYLNRTSERERDSGRRSVSSVEFPRKTAFNLQNGLTEG